MWREFIGSFGLTCFFATPATPEELDELETSLDSPLPPELRELLAETNGATFKPRFAGELGVSELAAEEEWMFDLVWSVAEIAEQNHLFQSWEEYVVAPIQHLIFFGAQPNGDPVALQRDAGAEQPSKVVVVSHEDWKQRRIASPSLRDYLTTLLRSCH